MAIMTQSESTLNKIPVFTPATEKQATKKHDNDFLHAPFDVFEKELELEEVLSPSVEKYGPLYSKENSASKNKGNVVVSTYNPNVLKELFTKVSRNKQQ